MATGRFMWRAWDGLPLDGSSGNAGPALLAIIGTESNPKKVLEVAAFDAATDEHIVFAGILPAEYASGGQVDIYWMANATTGTVRWGARIGAVTPNDVDTPVEHATATASTGAGTVNTTEARRLTKTSLTLSSLDSLAGGDEFELIVYRDGDGTSGTDDATVDAELRFVEFNFTLA